MSVSSAAVPDDYFWALRFDFGGQGFGVFKPALAELAIEKLSPITGEMNRLMADPGYLDQILATGANKAYALARPIMAEVRQRVGFLGSSAG